MIWAQAYSLLNDCVPRDFTFYAFMVEKLFNIMINSILGIQILHKLGWGYTHCLDILARREKYILCIFTNVISCPLCCSKTIHEFSNEFSLTYFWIRVAANFCVAKEAHLLSLRTLAHI